MNNLLATGEVSTLLFIDVSLCKTKGILFVLKVVRAKKNKYFFKY